MMTSASPWWSSGAWYLGSPLCCPWLRASLVVYKYLHLVDQVPGNPQDLLGIMPLSPLWGNMDNYGEVEKESYG